MTPHHNYNSTTVQLQLTPHYAILNPAVVGKVTNQVTSATSATIAGRDVCFGLIFRREGITVPGAAAPGTVMQCARIAVESELSVNFLRPHFCVCLI